VNAKETFELLDRLRRAEDRLEVAEQRISWLLARVPADTPAANGLYATGHGPEMRRGPGRPRKDATPQ